MIPVSSDTVQLESASDPTRAPSHKTARTADAHHESQAVTWIEIRALTTPCQALQQVMTTHRTLGNTSLSFLEKDVLKDTDE